jgi:hypothetical protein
MSKVPSDKFRPFRSRSPRGRGGDEPLFVRRSASPLRHGHCNKERGNGRPLRRQSERDRDADRTNDGRDRQRHERVGGRDRDSKQRGRAVSPLRRQSARDEERDRERDRERERQQRERERERERERNRESGGVRGGDAGGYRRDDKGQKDGGRDAHGRQRDCYGDSRGSEKFRVPQQNIDINKQIMRAQGASELCTLIEAHVAEFNHVVTAPHICLSCEHTYMTF